MTSQKQTDLDTRRAAMVEDLEGKIAGSRAGGGPSPKDRGPRLSRIRLRTLVLPALAVFLMVRFSGDAAVPVFVEAAFTPGSGSAFAGVIEVPPPADSSGDAVAPRQSLTMPSTTEANPAQSIPVEPGDVVGTTTGSPGTLTLGKGSLELRAGSRALLESVLPPRVRLLSGAAVAHGSILVVTANGILDQAAGETALEVGPEGLRAELRAGTASLATPDGDVSLAPGEERLVR